MAAEWNSPAPPPEEAGRQQEYAENDESNLRVFSIGFFVGFVVGIILIGGVWLLVSA